MFSLMNPYKTLLEYPNTKTQEELEVSVLTFCNQSSDFASVRFVNDRHSYLILFKTYYCQYCKQIVHLKMLL